MVIMEKFVFKSYWMMVLFYLLIDKEKHINR